MKNLWNNFLNLLFPLYCEFCKKNANQKLICNECLKSLTNINSLIYCKYCGVKLQNDDICTQCVSENNYFTQVCSVFLYDDNIAKLINAFKFHDCTYLAKYFAKYVIEHCEKMFHDVDLIIPVPLHRIKLFSRKYNQALLIAKFIGKTLKIDVDYSILKKIKHTKTQVKSNIIERKLNLKNSFQVTHDAKINNKIICLIDDVITTGTTIKECSKQLMTSSTIKPKEIRIISFARAIKC